MSSAFITPDQLKSKLKNDNVVLLDATYGQSVQYTLPNALIFDIDVIANPNASMPHMAPNATEFEFHVQNLGINSDSEIIIFDQTGFWMAASRAWWLFRLFGYNNVKILAGGLRAWEGDLTPYISTPRAESKGDFTANYCPKLCKSFEDVKNNDGQFILADARPAQAFKAGNIKDSLSIPLPTIIDHTTLKLKPIDELKEILSIVTNANKSIVTACGSGVTACALAVAFYECGYDDVAVYDGSWCEWNARLHEVDCVDNKCATTF